MRTTAVQEKEEQKKWVKIQAGEIAHTYTKKNTSRKMFCASNIRVS